MKAKNFSKSILVLNLLKTITEARKKPYLTA